MACHQDMMFACVSQESLAIKNHFLDYCTIKVVKKKLTTRENVILADDASLK